MKKYCIFAIPAFISMSAIAQSSVTLYGLIDEGIGYTNNASGKSSWNTQNGWVAGDRWGLLGSEDLGGGMKAIFRLETGFLLDNGRSLVSGEMFARQSYVGLQSDTLGTLTFGRQYDTVADMIGPLTMNGSYAGWPFSHPFDNDNTDDTFRVNNSVKYLSPRFNGLQFSGLYGFSNQAGGFANNRAFSAGITYTTGALDLGAAYFQANNGGANQGGAMPGLNGVGAYGDVNFIAKRQRVYGAGAKYTFNSVALGVVYTHSSFDDPVSSIYTGPFGASAQSLKFDNFEVNAKYQFNPALFAVAMYTFTRGHYSAGATNAKPDWNQGALMLNYSLSRRTSVYTQVAYQHVSGGTTGTGLDNAFVLGAAGPSSTRSQVLTRIGLFHTF
ncbi:porin [Paraburkholderia sp. ZP32-5]|uniref:porin n=1 Tax=Paraburkholderia sp. ZP32-5 TaxID=2883245 RepID=UPI001F397E15|nr:porin [Paraburkholderia sp. ZP32-5]